MSVTSYFAPYVDGTGLHYPTYNDILEALVNTMQTIYGSGIYLGSDSKDYQLLSAFAEKIFDTYQALEIAWNAHSPVTAIGTGLDYIVAVNGIRRKSASRSSAALTLTGTPGAVITDGIAADAAGNRWILSSEVTLGSEGTATAEALCEQAGAVEAEAGTITRIATPTAGWTAVTNPQAAVPGLNVETDSALRGRQAESVARPSQAMLTGLRGALLDLENVTRAAVYENDTNQTDNNHVPAHSVCCVVEGGDGDEIAETILMRKGVGCGTYGGETVTVTDEDDQAYEIHFSRPESVAVDIAITLSCRSGYAASTATEIRNAIVEYLSGFAIGEDLATSLIQVVAQQVNVDVRSPTFVVTAVQAARHGGTPGSADIAIGFDEVVSCAAEDIAITEVWP